MNSGLDCWTLGQDLRQPDMSDQSSRLCDFCVSPGLDEDQQICFERSLVVVLSTECILFIFVYFIMFVWDPALCVNPNT